MINNEKFEKAREFLYLEKVYPLLHETKKDKISSIIEQGLKLDKSYNGEISRVVNIPKDEDEFKSYNYYYDRLKKTILVLGIPKTILGDIPINSMYGHLILNCITEFQKTQTLPENHTIQFHELKFQRLPSIISNKWIAGYFDEDNNFLPNPNFIMIQENSEELISFSKKAILEEFHRRYPAQYLQLFKYSNESVLPINNSINFEQNQK